MSSPMPPENKERTVKRLFGTSCPSLFFHSISSGTERILSPERAQGQQGRTWKDEQKEAVGRTSVIDRTFWCAPQLTCLKMSPLVQRMGETPGACRPRSVHAN